MSDLTVTVNQDGSVVVPIEGKPVRFVKESDLLAVKGGAEKVKSDFDALTNQHSTVVNDWTGKFNAEHQAHLQTQAAHEQLKTTAKDLESKAARLADLEKDITAAKESGKQLSDKLLGRVKASLTSLGLKEDVFKDKNLNQLEEMENLAAAMGKQPGKPVFDRGSGAGSSSNTASRMDGLAAEIAAARAKRR
jgi:hypothetical protein